MRRERWGNDAEMKHRATPGPAAYDIDRGIKGVKWRLDENEVDFELKQDIARICSQEYVQHGF